MSLVLGTPNVTLGAVKTSGVAISLTGVHGGGKNYTWGRVFDNLMFGSSDEDETYEVDEEEGDEDDNDEVGG